MIGRYWQILADLANVELDHHPVQLEGRRTLSPANQSEAGYTPSEPAKRAPSPVQEPPVESKFVEEVGAVGMGSGVLIVLGKGTC